MDESHPDIEALLDAERARPPVDEAMQARLRARVGLGVGLGVGAAAITMGAAKGSAIKAWLSAKWFVLLTFFAGGLVGFALRGIVAPSPSVYVPVGKDVPPTLAPSASALPVSGSTVPPEAPVAASASASVKPAVVPAKPSVSVSASVANPAADEAKLVEMARTALVRGSASDALAALDLHAARHPNGERAEEREALAVQALVKAGRADDAKARAERFRKSFPGSIYLGAVNASIASLPP
ncbi:MAG: outer membrane protein assembly factor BamD [Myxococcales bacterium]|nr:outer membrane protein assembly factor BamD [Myxococcales bacterium]